MEIVDNLMMLAIPNAMESGIGSLLFWGSLGVALAIAGLAAWPVNRWLIKRGRGHAAMHEVGVQGGPPLKLVAGFFGAYALFGLVVLLVELT
jgi:hypothetical protein